MKKKLTLTIDETVTEKAKRLAKREGISVSEMIERYLRDKTAEESGWKPKPGSRTSELLGSLTLPEEYREKNYKKIKEKEILKKYGN
ncbi:MAG: DUF6364 family protein [Balneolaceae bacterium]